MRLHHPMWTHAPVVVLAGLVFVAFWRAWPPPDPSPVHFGGDGLPDRWGYPWEMAGVLSIVILVAVAISFAVDETWARAERRKRFNWFSLADELLVAFLAAVAFHYVAALAEEPYLIRSSWGLTAGLMAVAGLTAVFLELLRPLRLSVSASSPTDGAAEEEFEISDIAGKKWTYWEVQNPRYTRWYIPIFGVGLVILGLTTWDEKRWAAVLAISMGLVVSLAISGGFRISITRDSLTLRGGLLGFSLLRLPLSEIAEAKVHNFSPLADFGGYGIRRNRKMRAFFLQGNTGVRLTTANGETYLLGSEQPQRLAAVIRAVSAQSKDQT